MEVIRGAGGNTNWMDRKERLGNPESGGPQAPEPRDTTPGLPGFGEGDIGEGPAPFGERKICFRLLLPVPLGAL